MHTDTAMPFRSSDTREARRFWSWFEGEAGAFANGLAALQRGEADGAWMEDAIARRLRRVSPGLEADLQRTIDGECRLTVWGGDMTALTKLFSAAPRLAGWLFSSAAPGDRRQIPFRLAPQPSLDLGPPIGARHEAYA